MPLLQAVRAVTKDLNTVEMLRYLMTDRFAGKTVVTASLRSPSLVTLKMIADIDPSTPIVFVRPGSTFPDTLAHQTLIVEQLGLTNFSVSEGAETGVHDGDVAHSERMWVEYEGRSGKSFEIAHVNDTVAPYDCWISATYHVARAEHVKHRVDKEGRIMRIDPLRRWTMEEIYAFMGEHDIPRFERAYRAEQRVNLDENLEVPTTYAF